MNGKLILTTAILVAVALSVAVGVRALAAKLTPELPKEQPRLLNLSTAHNLRVAHQYAIFGGFDVPFAPYRITLRICDKNGNCPLRRHRDIESPGEFWGWLANITPSVEHNDARLFIQVPTDSGDYRTVAHHHWRIDVQ